ncbi:hypothetical protein Taro_038424 [Colocasia esculenta]|uniref:F-box domain-containing protein n=1 Tax=Colocasia esculenta TaxID=4460 RepID=A0A843WJ79_COLES|nr:hypothetical protein [Colocasia esculenta]
MWKGMAAESGKSSKKPFECGCSNGGGFGGEGSDSCGNHANGDVVMFDKGTPAAPEVERQVGASMMEQLVPEIKTHALSYLDYLSLCRLSMTNSSMRRAANDDNAWKALYHKDFTVEQDTVIPAQGWKAYYAATKAVIDVNAEFYNIIRERSLPAMSRLWLHADYVKCVHGSGELFAGNAMVRRGLLIRPRCSMKRTIGFQSNGGALQYIRAWCSNARVLGMLIAQCSVLLGALCCSAGGFSPATVVILRKHSTIGSIALQTEMYTAVMNSWALVFNWVHDGQGVDFEIRDVRARVLSDMAWVTMKAYLDMMDSGPFNVTNVYEFHDGRWYMVHHHSSVMPVDGDDGHHNILG